MITDYLLVVGSVLLALASVFPDRTPDDNDAWEVDEVWV